MTIKELSSQDPHAVGCVILTISDGASANHDGNGRLIESLLHEAGHEVVYRRVVKQGAAPLREALAEALADEECEAILISGGTGLSRKYETFETLDNLYEERLTGFGPLLTSLAFAEVGPSCLLYRPSAGFVERHPVFSLPDHHVLIRVGMEKMVLPELRTILHEGRR